MSNFLPIVANVPEKVSLRTHCPNMVRELIIGHFLPSEVCRCDVRDYKMKLHPTRCPSDRCPVRQDPDVPWSEILPKYELLEPSPKPAPVLLLLPYIPS